MENKKHILWYDEPAPMGNEDACAYADITPSEDDGWEKWSLPIGNGFFGANVFGRTVTERIQITENSFVSPGGGMGKQKIGGLANFAEIYLDIGHEKTENYRRYLDLDEAIAGTAYTFEGVDYKTEVFASYPDRVLVISLAASKPGALSFTLRPQIPFDDGVRHTGTIVAEGDTITMSGIYGGYRVMFEGQFTVHTVGGERIAHEKTIEVKQADSAYIVATFGTNYKLESRVFTEREPAKKLEPYEAPHARLCGIMATANAKGLDALRADHRKDYTSLFERVAIDFGGKLPNITTDELLDRYKKGERDLYLEELYFHYGRYLLIASSRPGGLPMNLQGIWNRYDFAPWSSGYWHNINIQMNYWPAFNTNLSETFEPYIDYNRAYMPCATIYANNFIRELYPEKYEEDNGWALGNSAWPYTVPGASTKGHSGPGTGAFTTALFWDYYRFSGDAEVLRNKVYPVIKGMAKFLSKVVIEEDGCYLTKYSASPEQKHGPENLHYRTKGCAFDQQMIWENHTATLKGAEVLGDTDPFLDLLREQVDRLDPVQIGASGQIKEYREEVYYSDIGDPHHRHISHLVGLFPGTLINEKNPAWLAAAEKTLEFRGDKSTGWAMAHRLNAWARVKNGRRAHMLYAQLLSSGTNPNLWDTHPPFQIDGNFGGTSGVAEMLLQSHEDRIEIIPCLPDEWRDGSFRGLTARDGFEVSAAWTSGRLTTAEILSKVGAPCTVKLAEGYRVTHNGTPVALTREGDNVTFATTAGGVYVIEA